MPEVTLMDGQVVPVAPETSAVEMESVVLGPVRGGGRGRGRAGTARWVVALIVVAVVAGASFAGIALVAAGGSASSLAGYAPASTTVYAELRTDLPGDQQAAVGELLANFPGFTDQSSLDYKIDQALGGLFTRVAGTGLDYGRDLKPWLGGEIAAAAGSLETLKPATGGGVTGGWALVMATAKEPDLARAFLGARLGQPTATQTYAGATLSTVTVAGLEGREIAWTVTGTTVLVGDLAAVESALDARATGGLAATQSFTEAVGQVPAAHVALAWADAPALASAAVAARGAFMPDASPLPSHAAAAVPAWIVGAVRAEPAGMTLEVVAPRSDGAAAGTAHVSQLASRLPGTTVAMVEVHDAGALLERAITAAAGNQQARAALGAAAPLLDGSLGSFVDWAGDGSVAVTRADGKMAGGIVALAADPTVAAQRLAAIRAFLNFADLPNGNPVVTEEPYGDGTIVTLDFGDLRPALTKALQGMSGPTGSGASGGLPAGLDPASIVGLIPASTSISYTVQRGVAVLGTDAAFVKAVVDTTPATSLAEVPAYQAAIGLAGASNDGQAFVDAATVVEVAKQADTSVASALGGDAGAFIARIRSLGAASTRAGDSIHIRVAVAVGGH
jgi:hypothetical protein